MQEIIFDITKIDQANLFGPKDTNLSLIRSHYPKIKVIARGDKLKVIGDSDTIDDFNTVWDVIIGHYNNFNSLNKEHLKSILNGSYTMSDINFQKKVLIYGNKGLVVRARTKNQVQMVDSIEKNDLLFAIGPAGTGKTYTAVALAVKALKNRSVKRIILTRPAVEAGENLGFLPGDLKDKLDPYLLPLFDALRDMIPSEKLSEYMEEGIIQIAPLGFMRGRTLDNAFVILDEGQNTTESQIKMFLTRMGRSAKFIITGDVTQIDLPKNQNSGLKLAMKLFKKSKGIDMVFLDETDVIRHPLVKQIIKAFNNNKS
ncbi:MAG: phosphate starvation-inducible protein PhoH [Crocinitomicaceae bacterium]|nr:phosphate starvation-inducible protein PhoH [Crocinitomicaceae bacterium]